MAHTCRLSALRNYSKIIPKGHSSSTKPSREGLLRPSREPKFELTSKLLQKLGARPISTSKIERKIGPRGEMNKWTPWKGIRTSRKGGSRNDQVLKDERHPKEGIRT